MRHEVKAYSVLRQTVTDGGCLLGAGLVVFVAAVMLALWLIL